MPTITPTHLRHSITELFIHGIGDSDGDDGIYYLFIGKILPWANESSPDTGNSSVVYVREAWNNMVSAKRIYGDSVKFAIPRINWTSNVSYTAYDDANPELLSNTNNKLYVFTSNNRVYKCISNANGAVSTVEPTGTTVNDGFIATGDGYEWKYMYTIDLTDNLFFTNDYIEVADTHMLSNSAIPGTVDRVVITNPGFAYNGGNTGNALSIITISGDGTGAAAVANVGSNGAITDVRITAHGTGYTYANVVAEGGTGAELRPIISPLYGHSANPAEEFTSHQAFIAMRIGHNDATEGNTFSVQNDFRQFGIVKFPYKYGTRTYENTNSVMQTTNITVVIDANPNFIVDDYVYQEDDGDITFSGYVVDISNGANTSVVRIVQTRGTPTVGELLYKEGAVTSKRIQSYENPALEPYSGDIIYLENVQKVQRNNNQSETFKIIIDF